jgi:exodeoxyribonuclease-3
VLIATWNVNSILARKERVLAWLQAKQPDVLCMQETKVPDEKFPFDGFREIGYYSAVSGQRGYNGVAIVSRVEPADVRWGLDDDAGDVQSRCIAASFGNLRVISIYAPNGASVGSDKYEYKLEWFRRLEALLADSNLQTVPTALCGDFNIAPDSKDVAEPEMWRGSVLFNREMTTVFREVLSMGLADTFRLFQPESGYYSWWDYQMLGFPRNNGLRIDHILASPPLADRCREAYIDREARKGTKPSDHAPVLARFEL